MINDEHVTSDEVRVLIDESFERIRVILEEKHKLSKQINDAKESCNFIGNLIQIPSMDDKGNPIQKECNDDLTKAKSMLKLLDTQIGLCLKSNLANKRALHLLEQAETLVDNI